jgi:hypothetical protein
VEKSWENWDAQGRDHQQIDQHENLDLLLQKHQKTGMFSMIYPLVN